MRKFDIHGKLAGKAYEGSRTNLTAECREYCCRRQQHIGEILAHVKKLFNETEELRRGIRQAFEETVLPEQAPHSGLKKLLDLVEDLKIS